MNDLSEIATTHVLPALASPIATWCTPHDGSHQNRREFSRFPVSGLCKVLQSVASTPASFPSSAVRPPRQARYLSVHGCRLPGLPRMLTGRRCDDARTEDRVDLLPAQAMVTPARKIERLEKQTDMKLVAAAGLRLIARSSFRSRALTAAARLLASRFPTTVVTAIG